jgi:hypothetical protein
MNPAAIDHKAVFVAPRFKLETYGIAFLQRIPDTFKRRIADMPSVK